MSILNSRPHNPSIKNDLILKIRIAQSVLGYKIASVKELKKQHINVLIKILQGLNYTYNKTLKRTV